MTLFSHLTPKELNVMTVDIKNLSCKRGEHFIFRKLSFSISAGELLVIKGQNGSGKTSLLKMIAGLILPDKGTVSWHHRNITESNDYCANMSFLGHKNGLKMALNPLENLANLLALGECKLSLPRVETVLRMLDLGAHCDKTCGQLSSGQQRKVALAAVILKQKPLWILDEPYTALDTQSIDSLNKLFMEHLANKGMIVMASHHPIKGCQHNVVNLSLQETL